MSGYVDAAFCARAGKFHLEADLRMGRETGVVFGPSGSGKSLFLRCLSGLHNISGGYIRLDGQTVSEYGKKAPLPPNRRGICLMPQNLSLSLT